MKIQIYGKIVVYTGGGSRTPKGISVYGITDFVDGTGEGSTYQNNVAVRNDDDLELIATKELDTAYTTSVPIELDLQ